MSVRHLYETAFDSTVKAPDADYLDDLAQSPLICGSLPSFGQDAKPNFAARTSAEHPSRHASSTSGRNSHSGYERKGNSERHRMIGPNQDAKSSFSRKCWTTTREANNHLLSSSSSISNSQAQGSNKCAGFSTDVPHCSTFSNSFPCRPHSDPLDRRKADLSLRPIAEHTSKSSPVFHLPLEQSTSTITENATKTFSPSTEFKKLEVGGQRDEKTQQSSHSSSGTVEMSSESIEITTEHEREEEQNVFKRVGIKDNSEQRTKEIRSSRDDIKRNHSEMVSTARMKLNLDLSQPKKRPRRHFLDFWTPGHDTFHEVVDPSVELEKQCWYHGFINHKDAENALKLLNEGSFLVRCCKTSQQNYSLSIKSASGVMHMKISQSPNGGYVLKQQSESFDSIPQMVHHFSMHPLPVYGLEHVILKSPVISQLL